MRNLVVVFGLLGIFYSQVVLPIGFKYEVSERELISLVGDDLLPSFPFSEGLKKKGLNAD